MGNPKRLPKTPRRHPNFSLKFKILIFGQFCTFANKLFDHHMLCQQGFLGSILLALPSKVSLTLCKASLLWLGLSAGQLLSRLWPNKGLLLPVASGGQHQGWPPPPATTTNSQLKTSFCPTLSIVSCHPHPAIFTSHLNSSPQTFVPTTVGNKIRKRRTDYWQQVKGAGGGNLKVIWNCGLSLKLHFQIRPGLKLLELRVLARWEESLLLTDKKS